MDFFTISLYLGVLFASFFFIFLLRKSNNNGRSNYKLPPGSTGWPLVGDHADFAISGPEKFINKKLAKFPSSEVFQTSLFGENMAVFCGPAAKKFFFSNDNKLFTAWLPRSMVKAVVFPSSDVVKDVTILQRTFFHDILKPEALRQYIPIMDSTAREHIDDEWVPNKDLKVVPLLKKYTFELGCRFLMNIDDPKRIKTLAEPFDLVASGMRAVPVDFPGTAYNGAIREGKKMRKELLDIVRERRVELSSGKEDSGRQDFLSLMLLASDKLGSDERVNEMMVTNSMAGMLLASYDSTGVAVAMLLYFLAELPHIYDAVYKEQMEIAKNKTPGEPLTWQDIENMRYSWNAARESLRLSPPPQESFREVTNDFTFAGYTIPKGWKALWTVHSTNKNPEYFPNPEEFDPSRFKGSGPPSYTFTPFGGGPRMCPGREYARLAILVFLHNIVTKFKLEKASKWKNTTYRSMSPTSKASLEVCVWPHAK
ncbi:beta-amyrin 6-beta-monooxygenase-like isoform X1 [Diospyros lotus]|uniref:beta-amyrin 6-beta-monooxygenase-like isoform X1 n=1 Tax=Diospyros lotus TaxID=55363 RepID=UPI00224CEF30|nr:beta-amyrin 6-beta-monooxygenase-like isoform X1 [Diospyros lotus]